MRYIIGIIIVVGLVFGCIFRYSNWNSFVVREYIKIEKKFDFFKPLTPILSQDINLDSDEDGEKISLTRDSESLYLSFFNVPPRSKGRNKTEPSLEEEYRYKLRAPIDSIITRLATQSFGDNNYLISISYSFKGEDYLSFGVFKYDRRPIFQLDRLKTPYPKGNLRFSPSNNLIIYYQEKDNQGYLTKEEYVYMNNRFIQKVKENVAP